MSPHVYDGLGVGLLIGAGVAGAYGSLPAWVGALFMLALCWCAYKGSVGGGTANDPHD